MRIDNIIPYEKNARDNSASIPAIAESIKQFGFRGQIKLRSHDNPVIVAGHHRVAACKSLGWTEIPDENICWCDDLSDEEVKALRLADNRTGEGGKWNKSLLREEVRAIKSIDMGKLNFDFKSKTKAYGAERLRTDDYYNLSIINRLHTSGKYDMPILEAVDFVPTNLLPFNYAKTATDTNKTLHFFIDDYQFERLWNHPAKYLDLIKQFEAAIAPDFSLYFDMPRPMQMWCEYRSRALANYWQRNGVVVIPRLQWTDDPKSLEWCFDGLPKFGTYAVSTIACKRNQDMTNLWYEGIEIAIKKLRPKRLIVYGGTLPEKSVFGDIEVLEFKTNTAFGGKNA